MKPKIKKLENIGKSSCNHSINIWDFRKSANEDNWTTAINLDDDYICRHFLHELGHKLGLPDTYPTMLCPDRSPIKSSSDIMFSSRGGAPLSMTHLDNESIAKILEPFCAE